MPNSRKTDLCENDDTRATQRGPGFDCTAGRAQPPRSRSHTGADPDAAALLVDTTPPGAARVARSRGANGRSELASSAFRRVRRTPSCIRRRSPTAETSLPGCGNGLRNSCAGPGGWCTVWTVRCSGTPREHPSTRCFVPGKCTGFKIRAMAEAAGGVSGFLRANPGPSVAKGFVPQLFRSAATHCRTKVASFEDRRSSPTCCL